MDGIDKPLAALAGRPLIDHVLARLRGQVDDRIISYNRNFGAYYKRGCTLVADRHADQGPIAGILAARPLLRTERVLIVPGDTPLIPLDLVVRLAGAAAPIALPRTATGRQNLICLIELDQLDSLAEFFSAGGRAMRRWLDSRRLAEVRMPEAPFVNVNSTEDLERLSAELASG